MKKKRANGEGTIRQRSNGLWEISILDGYKPNGKRNMKSFYGKSQKEARKKMLAYMDSKAKGIDVEANYFFPEWADIWFENHKTNITITTQENYKYTLRILKEVFQRKRIREIKPYDVELMLKRMYQEGRSSSYLSKCRAMLFQIMNKAEANDLILKNPVRYADKMRNCDPIIEKDAFTAEEVATLMRDLPRNPNTSNRMVPPFALNRQSTWKRALRKLAYPNPGTAIGQFPFPPRFGTVLPPCA